MGTLNKLTEEVHVAHVLPRCTEAGFLTGFSQTSRGARRLSYQCALAHLKMGAESAPTLGTDLPPLPETFWTTAREAQQFTYRFVKPAVSFTAGIEMWAKNEFRFSESLANEVAQLFITAYENKDTKLILAKRRLKSLPPQISELRELQILDVSDNELDVIPPSVLMLDNLKELDASGNRLRLLPEAVDRLSKLEQLFVSNNRLKALPSHICRLSRLEVLQANHNDITSLPTGLASMRCLKRIMLTHNRLTILPQGIAHMGQLEGLWLAHNALTDIEDAIAFLPKLRFITIEGNQFTHPPTAICHFIESHRPSYAPPKGGTSRSSTWFDWFLR